MNDIEKQMSVSKWFITGGVPGFDLNSLPRCQATAKTKGRRCGNPAMKNSNLCCVHAGLFKPGAPVGNQRALKHGNYTAKAVAERKEAREFLKEIEQILNEIQY